MWALQSSSSAKCGDFDRRSMPFSLPGAEERHFFRNECRPSSRSAPDSSCAGHVVACCVCSGGRSVVAQDLQSIGVGRRVGQLHGERRPPDGSEPCLLSGSSSLLRSEWRRVGQHLLGACCPVVVFGSARAPRVPTELALGAARACARRARVCTAARTAPASTARPHRPHRRVCICFCVCACVAIFRTPSVGQCAAATRPLPDVPLCERRATAPGPSDVEDSFAPAP